MKLSNYLPNVVPDLSNPDEIRTYLTQINLVLEEIARKAKSMQTEVRTTAPTTVDQFDCEGEDVRYNAGGVRRTYTLLDGEIRYHTET